MFSQNFEEQFILEYFKDKTGTFLSIGENDGVTLSNVRALALLGWRGVMVEPSPTAFTRLKENYKDMTGFYFYPFALGITNSKVKLWDSGSHLKNGDHGLLSTLNENELSRWNGSTEFNLVEVQCYRWKTFLNRLSIKNFDFISIDCEGLDSAILKQMDLTETSCICVEWNGKPELKELFDKMMGGFHIIYTSGENLVYAR